MSGAGGDGLALGAAERGRSRSDRSSASPARGHRSSAGSDLLAVDYKEEARQRTFRSVRYDFYVGKQRRREIAAKFELDDATVRRYVAPTHTTLGVAEPLTVPLPEYERGDPPDVTTAVRAYQSMRAAMRVGAREKMLARLLQLSPGDKIRTCDLQRVRRWMPLEVRASGFAGLLAWTRDFVNTEVGKGVAAAAPPRASTPPPTMGTGELMDGLFSGALAGFDTTPLRRDGDTSGADSEDAWADDHCMDRFNDGGDLEVEVVISVDGDDHDAEEPSEDVEAMDTTTDRVIKEEDASSDQTSERTGTANASGSPAPTQSSAVHSRGVPTASPAMPPSQLSSSTERFVLASPATPMTRNTAPLPASAPAAPATQSQDAAGNWSSMPFTDVGIIFGQMIHNKPPQTITIVRHHPPFAPLPPFPASYCSPRRQPAQPTSLFSSPNPKAPTPGARSSPARALAPATAPQHPASAMQTTPPRVERGLPPQLYRVPLLQEPSMMEVNAHASRLRNSRPTGNTFTTAVGPALAPVAAPTTPTPTIPATATRPTSAAAPREHGRQTKSSDKSASRAKRPYTKRAPSATTATADGATEAPKIKQEPAAGIVLTSGHFYGLSVMEPLAKRRAVRPKKYEESESEEEKPCSPSTGKRGPGRPKKIFADDAEGTHVTPTPTPAKAKVERSPKVIKAEPPVSPTTLFKRAPGRPKGARNKERSGVPRGSVAVPVAVPLPAPTATPPRTPILAAMTSLPAKRAALAVKAVERTRFRWEIDDQRTASQGLALQYIDATPLSDSEDEDGKPRRTTTLPRMPEALEVTTLQSRPPDVYVPRAHLPPPEPAVAVGWKRALAMMQEDDEESEEENDQETAGQGPPKRVPC